MNHLFFPATVNLAGEIERLVGLPEGLDWLFAPLLMLVGCGLILAILTVYSLFAVWLERKVSGHVQCRLGPMEVGPHGLLQTVADGIKLIAKEDIIPRQADRALFIAAPIVIFAGVFVAFPVIPLAENFVVADLNLGIFFIAAVGSIEAIGVIMAGWASNNKWSLFGAMRTATQVVSYEVPLGVSLLAVIVAAGSFSLREIARQQGVGFYGDGGWFWCWYLFRNPFMPVLFLIFFIAALAECKRNPFDLPEAESELVAGYHTEYSGMRFAIFFLAEYSAMLLVCAVASVLFLGGWYTGIPALDRLEGAAGVLLGTGTIAAKSMFLVFVQMWIRWTLPRVRLDQVMYFCLKVLLPFAVVSLVGVALWEQYLPHKVWFLPLQ
ncbi:MAG: NADH-quinone oxidoreductase subunit NuoH [Planctomycetes bacterium]|nr:NADH-quinone oxidoreductase subunit NuoH [Planctomycetota bacterium]